jgi:hypothetical protein
MNEKELRIGNFVKGANEDTGLSKDLLVFALEGGIECFSPIPLTEEWFDLNINHKESEWNFIGFGTRIIVQHNIFKSIKLEHLPNNQVGLYFNEELIIFKDYVHQLQNLYFALTEQELVLTK